MIAKNFIFFWQALRNWGEEGLKAYGRSNYLDNLETCLYSKTVFVNQNGELLKCPFSQFKAKNLKVNTQNKNCQECFSWGIKKRKKLKKASTKEDSTVLKKEEIIETVFDNYKDLKDQKIKKRTSFKISEFSNNVLNPENLNVIGSAMETVKQLKNLKFDWVSNYFAFPKVANLNLNYKNNLNYQFERKLKSQKEVFYPTVIEYLESVKLFGIKGIDLSGGDILLYSKFKNLLGFLKKENFFTVLNLDGWSFSKHQEMLFNFSGGLYNFDVYGASHNLHDKIVGKMGSFERIMEAAETLLEINKPVGFNYILTSKNIEEIGQMIEFASMIELRALNIIPLNQRFSNVRKEFVPSKGQIKKIKKVYHQLIRDQKMTVRCGLYFPQTNNKRMNEFLEGYYKL